jgi:hypothetical protein
MALTVSRIHTCALSMSPLALCKAGEWNGVEAAEAAVVVASGWLTLGHFKFDSSARG